MQLSKYLSCLLLSTALLGCSSHSIPLVYKVDIPQGNLLTADQVKKLKVGLSQQEVQFLLGTPLLQDPFHKNRWDYYYHFKPGQGPSYRSHLQILFDQQGKVAKLDYQSSDPDQAPPLSS